MENDVTSLMTDNRDFERRQDRIEQVSVAFSQLSLILSLEQISLMRKICQVNSNLSQLYISRRKMITLRFELLCENLCSELKSELLIIACDAFIFFVYTNRIMEI